MGSCSFAEWPTGWSARVLGYGGASRTGPRRHQSKQPSLSGAPRADLTPTTPWSDPLCKPRLDVVGGSTAYAETHARAVDMQDSARVRRGGSEVGRQRIAHPHSRGVYAGAGMHVRLPTVGDTCRVPAAVGLTLHRIVQEAQANVAKHATRAAVRRAPAGSSDG
jgi:hypothetical protein